MNKTLSTLLLAAAATLSLGTHAATADASADATLTKSQAGELKDQSDARYKANKKTAEANLDLNKADCKAALSGGVERACKNDAKALAKKDKADAKLINRAEKADIQAETK